MKYRLKFGKPVKSILQTQDAFFFLGCLIVFLMFSGESKAQQKFFNSTLPESMYELNDFLLNDTITKKDTAFTFKMTRSPGRAMLYSAVIPGAGQFYNESYWKIPIIWGIGGYFVYEIIKNNNNYIDYRDLYANSQTPENPNGDLRYKNLREFYRDQRDQFYLYAGLVYLINLVDAYVDAHLFDFDVSDKIQVQGLKGSNSLMNLKINL
ncbi:MAG: DUF5683 domain-containing protein [Ignavibacteria bacterium]